MTNDRERLDPGVTVCARTGDLELEASTEHPDVFSPDEVLIRIFNPPEYKESRSSGTVAIYAEAKQIVKMLRHCGFNVVYHGRLEGPSPAETYISHLMDSMLFGSTWVRTQTEDETDDGMTDLMARSPVTPEERFEYETLKGTYERFRGALNVDGDPEETAGATGDQ